MISRFGKTIEPTSRESFEAVFADVVVLPSYLEISKRRTSQEMPDASITEWYNQSVELARDAIYAVPETNKHHENADRWLLRDIFANSDGSEVRMVVTGFKPAAEISTSNGPEDTDTIGEIPTELLSVRSLLTHGLPNPDLAFTHGLKYLTDASPQFNSGFVYSKSAISALIAGNLKLLGKLGYDTTQQPEHMFEEVFSSTDKFTQSLFLGYPPYTSLLYQAIDPSDLIIFDHTARDNPERAAAFSKRFWEVAQVMTNPKQFALLQRLAANPERFEGLGLLGTSTDDYIMQSSANQGAQSVLHSIGMTKYVATMRAALGVPENAVSWL